MTMQDGFLILQRGGCLPKVISAIYFLTMRALNFKSMSEIAKPVMSPTSMTPSPDKKSVVSPFQ